MKNILFLLFFAVSCKTYTQQTIVPLRTYTDIPENAGYYMKDTNNELQSFEGTWDGTWNNKTIFITFKKLINSYNQSLKYNADIIIGKFKTLNSNGNILLDNTQSNDQDSKIKGIGFQNITDKYIMFYYDKDLCRMTGDIEITFANTAKTQLNFSFHQDSQVIDSDLLFSRLAPS